MRGRSFVWCIMKAGHSEKQGLPCSSLGKLEKNGLVKEIVNMFESRQLRSCSCISESESADCEICWAGYKV